MGLGLGLGLGPALGACWPLPEAQNLLKNNPFPKGACTLKKLTRRRPALGAEGTKLVKKNLFQKGACTFQEIDPPEACP